VKQFGLELVPDANHRDAGGGESEVAGNIAKAKGKRLKAEG